MTANQRYYLDWGHAKGNRTANYLRYKQRLLLVEYLTGFALGSPTGNYSSQKPNCVK